MLIQCRPRRTTTRASNPQAFELDLFDCGTQRPFAAAIGDRRREPSEALPKKGAYVRPITEAEVESVMQARGLVEDWCARRAAHRARSDPAGRSPCAASFPARMLLAAPGARTAPLAAVVAPVLAPLFTHAGRHC
jgi:hypothetical protein